MSTHPHLCEKKRRELSNWTEVYLECSSDNDDPELWLYMEDCAVQVNYCPMCGFEAKQKRDDERGRQ